MKRLLKPVLIALVVFAAIATKAQTKSDSYNPLQFGLQAKSGKNWRGLEISDQAFLETKLSLANRKGNLSVGVRGSNSFNGEYKQFDYFVNYQLGKFRFSVWDIYNFSDYLKPDTDLFNYSAATTRHFIDATVAYQISEKFPLDISWSTMIFGRDRDTYASDIVEGSKKDDIRRGANRYSTYLQLSYPFQAKEINFKPYVGGVFAFNGKNTFYSNKAGIATFGFDASKKVSIGNYEFPLSVKPYWNTFKNTGGVEFAIQLLK